MILRDTETGEWIDTETGSPYGGPKDWGGVPTADWQTYTTPWDNANPNWGVPNYAGAGRYSLPIAKQLNKSGKVNFSTTKDANAWYQSFGDGGTDPLADWRMAQKMAEQYGLLNDPQVSQFLQSGLADAQAYTAQQQAVDKSGKLTFGDVLKGAAFALLPAAVGPALQGISGATALGGGLAGDVLSGKGLSALRTGLGLGGSVLSGMETPRGLGDITGATGAVTQQPTSTLSSAVLPTPASAPEQTLSSSVMSVAEPTNLARTPRRPQIRLTPGFRRGY